MLIRNFAMGACLLCVGTSFAADKHYTVEDGDTLSGIAHKFGVSVHEILSANDLKDGNHLRVGKRLVVPTAASDGHAHASSGGYKVREGDNDVRIAHRLHITEKQLHELNPKTRWSALQIGSRLNVPGSEVVKSSSTKKVVAEAEKHTSHGYKVRPGDNDVRIAKKLGITDKALRHANPDTDWDALQIGAMLRVPGGKLVASNERSHKVPEISSKHALIASDDVNVRRKPSTGAELVVKVDQGTKVTVLDQDGSWYKVRFPKGTKGWVRGDFLESTKPSRNTRVASRRTKSHGKMSSYVASRLETAARGGDERLLSTARSLLGTPYVYGGTSRHGLDCSAFTSTVFKKNGVTLPRTSREQASVGHKVSRNDLKPGDLVFFRTGRSSRINHVAIYEGHGRFIHASSGGGEVKESSLSEGYYSNRFVTARRVIKANSAKSGHAAKTHRDAKHSSSDESE